VKVLFAVLSDDQTITPVASPPAESSKPPHPHRGSACDGDQHQPTPHHTTAQHTTAEPPAVRTIVTSEAVFMPHVLMMFRTSHDGGLQRPHQVCETLAGTAPHRQVGGVAFSPQCSAVQRRCALVTIKAAIQLPGASVF
jgi:hypothetical protein